jgi:hypothetical protein
MRTGQKGMVSQWEMWLEWEGLLEHSRAGQRQKELGPQVLFPHEGMLYGDVVLRWAEWRVWMPQLV